MQAILVTGKVPLLSERAAATAWSAGVFRKKAGLVSYEARAVDGSDEVVYPLGEHPQGIIMYTPDGFMSAQLMRPGRPNFQSQTSTRPAVTNSRRRPLVTWRIQGPTACLRTAASSFTTSRSA